jgi:hypothetical protein
MLHIEEIFGGGHGMKLFALLIAMGVLVPTQSFASGPASAPEPLSLALLAGGFAGLGAAELIRRRKSK